MQQVTQLTSNIQPSAHSVCLENQQRLQDCESLETEITTLAGHINAANHRFIKLLAEFDKVRGWQGQGIKSFAHWLNWRCGINLMMAREKVRVARALGELPQIDQAFGTGEISYSKVRAMTRAATPDNEALLLQVAQYGTASHIEKLVSKFRWVKNLNSADDNTDKKTDKKTDENNDDQTDSHPTQKKRLNWHQDEDGSLVFFGHLPAEDGALVVKAIEMILDDMYQQSIEDARDRILNNTSTNHNTSANNVSKTDTPKTNVSAETFYQDGPNTTEPLPDWSEMRANSLVRLAEASLTGENFHDQSNPGLNNKHHLLIHINENAAHPDFRINGGALHYLDSLDSNHFLSPEVVKRLACDALVTTIIEDDDGHPLNIGRKTRILSTAIKRALHVRDGGCRYPGCCQTRWTDAHHIEHWVNGGETRLDNLITLCHYHHTQLHQGEYRIRARNNEIHFINASNRVIPGSFSPQFKKANHRPEHLQHTHQQLGLEIDRHTADCKWLGDSMDYSATICGLISEDTSDYRRGQSG